MDPPTRPRIVPPALLGLIACAAAFTWLVNQGLPDPVASHFGPAGEADAFMPRGQYIAIMLAVTVVAPLLIVVVVSYALSRPGARINVPNRDYWLAPERRGETIQFVKRQIALFATFLVVFLCYAQWLAARANALSPPNLDPGPFFAGLGIFMACTIVWVVRLVRHFR
jgi:uncharacterized membrane protein